MELPAASLPSLPFVGRDADLELLHSVLDDAGAGRGRTLILTGASGVGKTRMTVVAAEEAARRGWTVAAGRAYPVETGMPYALVSDAMMTILEELGRDALEVLTRGSVAELGHLFPALRLPDSAPAAPLGRGAEQKTRLLWSFTRFLARLAAREPVLVVFEDLHWADASSLELFHFLARNIAGNPIAIVGTVNDAHRAGNATLRSIEHSLTSLDLAVSRPLEALSLEETGELVCTTFGVEHGVAQAFIGRLFRWTLGNPFFMEETLKSLIHSGRLHRRDGVWLGWGMEELQLPRTVRDLLLLRAERLSVPARTLAEIQAVLGTDARYAVLHALSALPERDLVVALEELCRGHILQEREERNTLVYDFRHPLMRESLLSEVGGARARVLHGDIARTLEREYGDAAPEHAEQLAFHFARADVQGGSSKAIDYLTRAGRAALERFAYREAADFLSAALERSGGDAAPGASGDADGTGGNGAPGGAGSDGGANSGDGAGGDSALVEDLARARQRLGEYEEAVRLWSRARDGAAARGDAPTVARCERRLGLAARWSGRHAQALEHFAAGLAAAEAAGDSGAGTRARIRLSLGECLQELGQGEEARAELEEALEIARAAGDDRLVARAHFALVLLHTWIGPPDVAREHGARGLELAEQAGDVNLSCTLHYGLAVLEGLIGEGKAATRHIERCETLAIELGSPLHRLFIAEVALEATAGRGEWDEAIALGERAITVARNFRQHTLLPRLLVWTALIYCGRGDLDRAKEYIDEAWEASGAGRVDPDGEEPFDIHTVLPAHSGMAGYHLAREEYTEAVRVGDAGLALADRSGYSPWAIHRLLPLMLEAAMLARDYDAARRIRDRLRADSEHLGHRLGLAWAESCDALLVFIDGDIDRSLLLLRAAAEQLEAIPFVFDGARLRRQLAARLRDSGQRDDALAELRRIHEVFQKLGAREELSRTREQMRELGGRPMPRESAQGAEGLTAREVEIVRLVMAGKSNKAIGRALDISPRTVSTHLSNVFRKLEVGSRGELADRARLLQLPAG